MTHVWQDAQVPMDYEIIIEAIQNRGAERSILHVCISSLLKTSKAGDISVVVNTW